MPSESSPTASCTASDFLADRQRGLQAEAKADGIAATDHGAYDGWLGNEVAACDVTWTPAAMMPASVHNKIVTQTGLD
jgi:hypothetical protein